MAVAVLGAILIVAGTDAGDAADGPPGPDELDGGGGDRR